MLDAICYANAMEDARPMQGTMQRKMLCCYARCYADALQCKNAWCAKWHVVCRRDGVAMEVVKEGLKVGENWLKDVRFADDQSMVASTERGLQ